MKLPKKKKSQFDKVRDADDQNWVDLFFPSWTVPYLRLSRADRPAGTWLLLIPCWWGILLAANEKNNFGLVMSDFWLLIACTIGAFLMRGAGCTWNDILDKDFDKLVERTRSRPIPAGQITVIKAMIWMVICILGMKRFAMENSMIVTKQKMTIMDREKKKLTMMNVYFGDSHCILRACARKF